MCYPSSLNNIASITLKTTATNIAKKKLSISNPGTKKLVATTTTPLITRLNNPNVKNVRGNEMTFNGIPTTTFAMAYTTVAINALCQLVTTKPGTTLDKNKNNNVLIINLFIKTPSLSSSYTLCLPFFSLLKLIPFHLHCGIAISYLNNS